MDRTEIDSLVSLPLEELVTMANRVRRDEAGQGVELCNIMNAKSGHCGEDCKFCAQSSRHRTAASSYSLKNKREMVEAAKKASVMGAHRFSIVTSGNDLMKRDLQEIAEAVLTIRDEVGINVCVSLGRLDEESLALLKRSGLSRYHHNIETSPRYFPRIVTTHTFRDRVDTVRAAKRAGLGVCCGGIIGMGETWDDRIEMALALKELDVDSVPINILVPVEGAALEKTLPLSPEDAIRAIAIFRIILKDKIIKIAAGRESVLKNFQAMAFMAGANGMLVGNYLTTQGRDIQADMEMIKDLGFIAEKGV